MGLLQRLTGTKESVWCNGAALVIRREGLFGVKKEKLQIGSAEWRAWLGVHNRLEYRDKSGASATLRKERRGKNYYWYAYAYGVGRGESVCVYVGCLERLPAAALRLLIYTLIERKKEKKAMTDAERARRKRRSAAARQRRHRHRLAAGQAGRSPGREQDTEK